MITVEEAKMLMNSGKSIYYKGIQFMRISALTFKKSNGKYSTYAELLDRNRNCIYTVPLEFLEKDKVAKRIDLPRFTKIKEQAEIIKDISCQLFYLLDSGKLEDSQDKLHFMLEESLKLENLLSEEIRNNEKPV